MADSRGALAATIGSLAEKVQRYRDRAIGEQNTKASLIEPLLESLGWNIRYLDCVHREYRPKKRDKPVDYALKLLRRPRLLIEAKGLGEKLSDRKWISYATVVGVEWCVLTDGNEYRIYNATAPVDAEEKLFGRVCIADEDVAAVAGTLDLISRSNLEENLIDVHWEALRRSAGQGGDLGAVRFRTSGRDPADPREGEGPAPESGGRIARAPRREGGSAADPAGARPRSDAQPAPGHPSDARSQRRCRQGLADAAKGPGEGRRPYAARRRAR